jgi:hypothetical protein
VRRVLVLAQLLVSLGVSGCGLPGMVRGWFEEPPGPRPDLGRGVEVVDERTVYEFQARAQAFYDRLSRRRFNTHATFSDPVLRDYFQTPEQFYDYYADLAYALETEVFEKNRALMAEVKEFAIEAPGRARVAVRMRGDNGLPLRYWTIVLEREDVWERVDGTWWLVPGKL